MLQSTAESLSLAGGGEAEGWSEPPPPRQPGLQGRRRQRGALYGQPLLGVSRGV